MNYKEFIETVSEIMKQAGLGRISTPIAAPPTAAEVQFTPFGIRTPGATFSTEWKFEVSADSKGRLIQAFFAGTISYARLASGNEIVLRNGDVLGQVERQATVPEWFPDPKYVVYTYVDEAETRQILLSYLLANPNVVDAIRKQPGASIGTGAPGGIMDAFIDGTLPFGIPVPAGLTIGMAEVGNTADTRRLAFHMHEEWPDVSGVFLDPAIYHHHWRLFFTNPGAHPLATEFTEIFAGPMANGTVRYVGPNGGTSGDFQTPSAPADKVSTALAVANAFDTIVLAPGTYAEGAELDVHLPVAITSLARHDVTDVPPPVMPTLDGGNKHRVIRVHSTDGPVSITNVAVSAGRIKPRGTTTDVGGSGPRCGGGILIERVHRVYMRNCLVSGNNVEARRPFAGLATAGEDGFGGGICTFQASAYIYNCRIEENTCGDRGGGIGIFGYGWPLIERCVIRGNAATAGAPLPVTGQLIGRADGGGIAAEVAFPSDTAEWAIWDYAHLRWAWNEVDLRRAARKWIRIRHNKIMKNSAADDGGGVYLSVRSRATFEENDIAENKAYSAGGGVRATMASDFTMEGDFVHDNLSNSSGRVVGTSTDIGVGGGGIATRNVSVKLKNVRLKDNVAEGWSGGGAFFSSSDEGPLAPAAGEISEWGAFPVVPDLDANDVLRGVFDAKKILIEVVGSVGSIQGNHSTFTGGTTDHRKGGGVYALRYWEDRTIFNFTALPLEVTIDEIGKIAGNHLDPATMPIGFPQSTEFHIQDMVAPLVVDGSNSTTYTINGRLRYDST